MAIRAAVMFALSFAAMFAVGASMDQTRLGAIGGILAGSGFALVVGVERLRRGPLALPPITAVIGAILIALGVAAVVRPAAIFLPAWIVQIERVDVKAHYRVPASPSTRVLSDADSADLARKFAPAIGVYRSHLPMLLGEDRPLTSKSEDVPCPVDIVLANAAGVDRLSRAAEMRNEFGFFHAPVIGRPVIVARDGSGWGSLTHHWMYALATCYLGDAQPRWVYVGVAALAEKHAPVSGELSFRFRSDWRSPDKDWSAAPVDLRRKLILANDQGFLRNFFLFLLDRGYLTAFMRRLRDGVSAEDALVKATGLAFEEIEPAWRFWHANEGQAIPTLREAKPLFPDEAE